MCSIPSERFELNPFSLNLFQTDYTLNSSRQKLTRKEASNGPDEALQKGEAMSKLDLIDAFKISILSKRGV